ncbi:unnamed protein product [Allacma fusca]|uniref:Uncharacterized protein n=1 Tax=Allacma fusca TaxID=39272 RepID=A0A8J2JW00_9HEXA|nr:unnamed protein product [Allacma fusca]
MARCAQYLILLTVFALVLNMAMAAPSESEGLAEESQGERQGCRNGHYQGGRCVCNQGYQHAGGNNNVCIQINVNNGK